LSRKFTKSLIKKKLKAPIDVGFQVLLNFSYCLTIGGAMRAEDLYYTPESTLKYFEGRYKDWSKMIQSIDPGRTAGSWRLPDDPALQDC
jgi:hypothetical protein